MRQSVEKIRFNLGEGRIVNTSLSFGVAQFKDFMNINEAIKGADLALYEAKKAGGNIVILNKGKE